MSNASTFCSFVTKESEETKATNSNMPLINLNFERATNSTPKFPSRKIKLLFLNIKKKSFKSKDNKELKPECEKTISKSNSKNKLILDKLKEINKNNITSVNKSNKFIPAPDTKKESGDKKFLSKNDAKVLKPKIVNKEKKLNSELYSQSHNLSCMKKFPPKLPEMLNFETIMQNKLKGTMSIETYGQLSKGKIPNIFFGHLMVNCSIRKNRYLKSSMTQRNKNKLLTIFYYKPL